MTIQKRHAVFLFLLFFCSCFGMDRSGGIMKYKAGQAVTGKTRFNVPRLPPPWKSPKIRLKQLVHENDPLRATIVVDALCGPKYDDGSLPRLAAELFQKMTDRKTLSQKNIEVAGRSAFRMIGRGKMDGVPLQMDVVVLKKNLCLYDLVYVSPPETYAEGVRDFEGYFHEFKTHD